MGVNKSKKSGSSRSPSFGKEGKPSKVPFSSIRFVRIELSETERAEFKSLVESGEFEHLPLDVWCETGYKLSVSRDPNGNGCLATLTGQYTNMPNAGLVLSGRGRDAATAMAVLEFKDRYLCDDGGWSEAETARGGGYTDIA